MKKIIFVIGPTATGKTDIAIEKAKELGVENAEIIGADSRQIYKGFDLCTGKVLDNELAFESKKIIHHGISFVNLNMDFTVVDFQNYALPIIEKLLNEGKTPIICGGTGLYIEHILFDIDLPKVLPNKTLREELKTLDTETLLSKLSEKDPQRAERMDKNNRHRIIRALEIVESLGIVPISQKKKRFEGCDIEVIDTSKLFNREELKKRIEKRWDNRVEQGMVEEVKNLLEKNNFNDIDTKKFGIEFFNLKKYLEGEIGLEEVKRLTVEESVKYSKRQKTWFKKYS